MVTEQLGNLFRVRSGDGISIANLSAFGIYPVYGGNGVNGYTSNYNVENETMVIGRVGEKCGNVKITQSRGWVSDNALIVTPKVKYDIEYMRYLLEQINLNDYANRNAQPVISGQIIYALETPYVGDVDEQETFNDRTGLHKNYHGKIKNDKYNNMGTEVLMAICVGLRLNLRIVEKIFDKSDNKLNYYQDPDKTYIRILENMPGLSLQDFNGVLKQAGIKELGSTIKDDPD